MTHVLYVNLWGTTAKIPEEQILECQRYFHRALRELTAGVDAQAFGDYAYAFANDVSALVDLGARLFQSMCFINGTDLIWPLRAAIAGNVTGLLGPGTVHAAELEKSAQKGMRLLVDRRCGFHDPWIRTIDVRGTTHLEYNWMKVGGWLTPAVESQLQTVAESWMNEGTNYSQQMASSLFGLQRWAASTSI